ncbi:MAG: hypothetical protein F6K18_00290 [Okeania sp. SIO2C2]|nr:hypothetical protein [Okeania sp. SIO2C2]NEP85389.1 hypothetical protein [Okeania sp. SIO2C2]
MASKTLDAETLADNLSKIPKEEMTNQEIKELIDKLLQELLPLAAIARFTEVSEPW